MAKQGSVDALAVFDAGLRTAGLMLLAGVDEAGRGPLAGPVTAAAVILPPQWRQEGINDSKVLSKKQRERAFTQIMHNAYSVGLGLAWPERIDQINILQASLEAMRYAVCGLNRRPELILFDGPRTPALLPEKFRDVPVRAVVDGDAKSLAIAAASVIAKCVRDSIMDGYERLYPGYGFSRNKGYGTAAHLLALQTIGPCQIHRRSFRPVKSYSEKSATSN